MMIKMYREVQKLSRQWVSKISKVFSKSRKFLDQSQKRLSFFSKVFSLPVIVYLTDLTLKFNVLVQQNMLLMMLFFNSSYCKVKNDHQKCFAAVSLTKKCYSFR